MRIPNKRELQQIAFNHSSNIDFQDFLYPYKKFLAKPYSFFIIYTTLTSIKLKNIYKNIKLNHDH